MFSDQILPVGEIPQCLIGLNYSSGIAQPFE